MTSCFAKFLIWQSNPLYFHVEVLATRHIVQGLGQLQMRRGRMASVLAKSETQNTVH